MSILSKQSQMISMVELWKQSGKTKKDFAEENGLSITNLRFLDFTEDYFEKEVKHYITMFMIADYVSGEPQNLEPEKCNGWKWFEWNKELIPENIFLPLKNLLKKEINI